MNATNGTIISFGRGVALVAAGAFLAGTVVVSPAAADVPSTRAPSAEDRMSCVSLGRYSGCFSSSELTSIERGIGSVLERLAPNGEVAHEEDIGEFAILRNVKDGRGRSDQPIYDYGMVDDDFMLAPLAVSWLLSSETTLLWHLPAIDLSEEIAKRLDAAPPQK